MRVVSNPEPAPAPAVSSAADPAPAEPAPVQADEPPVEETRPTPFPAAEPARRARPKPVEVARRQPGAGTPKEEVRSAESAPAVASPPPAPAEIAQSKPAETAKPVEEPRVLVPLAPPPPDPPRQVTIAAGTLLPVRLVETLASDRMAAGDSFSATLDAPLIVDGLVIAERGAKAQGRVARIEEAGRVRGVAALAIELTSLRTSDGQTIRIDTDAFEREAEKTVAKDAAKVGVAAGIGAAIGAIAGGGKGAGIGAAVGGAAGTGGVLATRGKPVVIPSETKISFRLSKPVTVTEKKK